MYHVHATPLVPQRAWKLCCDRARVVTAECRQGHPLVPRQRNRGPSKHRARRRAHAVRRFPDHLHPGKMPG